MIDRLAELRESLVTMSTEDRHALLRSVRDDRKVSKYAVTVKKKQAQDKGDKMKNAFASMSAEEKAEFLAMIGADDESRTI